MMSKEAHDKEIFIDEKRKLLPSDLSDDQVFRSALLEVLERIARVLEKPYQVRFEY